jgi:poly-gamma-glutamate synthesis protein (capsule biosynthesis protein)
MKRIKIVYGIAGGLLLLAGVLLLALFRPGAFLHLERKQTEATPKPEPDSKPEVSWQESEQEESKQQELEQQESEQQESKQEKTEDSKNPADIASPKEEENEPDRKGFSMAFFGDTYYNRQRLWQYQNNGIKGLLDDSLIRLIAEADVAVLNHECAFSDGGTPMADKEYTYRMTPSLADSYVEMGIDLVTLANNHALDFGTEALSDTFSTLDQYGIDYIGAGENYERAKQAAVYELDGKTVAVLAASRVIPVVEWNILNRQPGMFCTYDSTALEEEIRACKEQYDYVVVYVHWGVMEMERPEEYQREMAYRYIDAGADVVIGTHPHVVQSIEFYQGKPIYYSLGNFLYGTTIQRTMLLLLEVDGSGVLQSRIYPCYAQNGTTCQMGQEEGTEFYRYMESISYSVQIDDKGYVKESEDGRS